MDHTIGGPLSELVRHNADYCLHMISLQITTLIDVLHRVDESLESSEQSSKWLFLR